MNLKSAGNLNDYYYNQLEQLDIIDKKNTYKLGKKVEEEIAEPKSPMKRRRNMPEESKLYGKNWKYFE